jgi:hypothetical protein
MRASLFVESWTTPPDVLTQRIGLSPDEVTVMGEPSSLPGRTNLRHTWEYALRMPTEDHVGTVAMSQAIEKLGLELAERLSLLASEGAKISLDVVQEVNGDFDFAATGILLSADAVEWLGRARAMISVDQYFDSGVEAPAPPS